MGTRELHPHTSELGVVELKGTHMRTYCKMMHSIFKMMHSTPGRLLRLFGGLWLVIYGADLAVGYAFTLAILGAAIAVTGVADICPMELVVNAVRSKSRGPHQRAA